MNASINREARRNALQSLAGGRATLCYRFWCKASGECCPVGAIIGDELAQSLMGRGLNGASVTQALRELRISDTDERFGFSVDELSLLQSINDGSFHVIEGASGHGPSAVKDAATALLAGMPVVAAPRDGHPASKEQVISPNL